MASTDLKDPYAVLGVPKTSSAEALKKAFRDLAKKYHPDRNKDDKTAERKFKEINAAYDIVGDEKKRARYDRGEIDAAGNERGFGGGGTYGGDARYSDFGGRAGSAGGGFGSGFSAEDIFSEFFGGGKKQQRQSASGRSSFNEAIRGEDVKYDLSVTFLEAVRGGKRRITLSTGKTVDITIPAGTRDGDTLRLKGQGGASRGGGVAGDAHITLKVETHPYFTLKGLDIHLDVPVSLPEAVLGGEITVPTLDGSVQVKVPKGANSGTQLRLKGKGAIGKSNASGNQILTLKIMLPEKDSPDLAKVLEKWAAKNSYNPRKF